METWVMSVAAVWALGLRYAALCSGDRGLSLLPELISFQN